jgi:carbonic anhydrase
MGTGFLRCGWGICLGGAFFVGFLPLNALSAELDSTPEHPASKNESQVDWDYSSAHGPQHWGELDPAYVLATIGGSQSPIDIRPGESIRADLPTLSLDSHPQTLHLLNNGHTVETICPGAATLHFGEQEYDLRQFHFHAPSEHTIEGKHAELELHFVHADGEGHLAVIAILFYEGEAEHPEIAEMLSNRSVSHAGDEVYEESTRLDVSQLMPNSMDYYTYDGSLTTPPASEGVRWFVLKNPLHLTRDQISAIKHVYNSNNRPTQPLNARFVLTGR